VNNWVNVLDKLPPCHRYVEVFIPASRYTKIARVKHKRHKNPWEAFYILKTIYNHKGDGQLCIVSHWRELDEVVSIIENHKHNELVQEFFDRPEYQHYKNNKNKQLKLSVGN